jgi:hypothetical protein
LKTYDLSFANETGDQILCENEKNCATINLEQFINAYLDQNPVYCITFDKDDWDNREDNNKCAGLSMNFYSDNLNGSSADLLYVV